MSTLLGNREDASSMNKREHRAEVFVRAGRTKKEVEQDTKKFRDILNEANVNGWEFVRVETLSLSSDGREECRIIWRRSAPILEPDTVSTKIPKRVIGTVVITGLVIWALTATFVPEPMTSIAIATGFFLIALLGLGLYLHYRKRKP